MPKNSLEEPSLTRFIKPPYLLSTIAGGLLPWAFAPFSLHGLALLSLALLAYRCNVLEKQKAPMREVMCHGLFFGLGFFGVGVSWVMVSIHDYGHTNYFVAFVLTSLFILYLASFMVFTTTVYVALSKNKPHWIRPLLFAFVWVMGEFLRAHLFTGFPWLLIGYSQIDTPLQYLAPLIGTYGISYLSALCAGLLAIAPFVKPKNQVLLPCLIVILYGLASLSNIDWTVPGKKPTSIGVVQANLAMHDKWDSALFWQIVHHYEQASKQLYKNDVIIWPESAIPLEAEYVKPLLTKINEQALKNHSAVILGIPKVGDSNSDYYNSLISLGDAKGYYLKQHLVPFGEYIPNQWMKRVANKLGIPLASLIPGPNNQGLVQVKGTPIASLICYEVAFSNLLRKQLPKAQWIVTLSDDGWFGHTFAMAQHLEMARMRSLEVSRFQVLANNNGLSSIIDTKGRIKAQLKPFVSGNLQASLLSTQGKTPWLIMGDYVLFLSLFLVTIGLFIVTTVADRRKRRYP